MMMLFFLLYCFFMSILFRKKSNFSLLVSLLPFFLFGSLRHFSVGNDSIEYARVYQIISSSGSDIFKHRYELGFLKLNEILSSISNSYTLLFIVTMAITVYALYVMLRDYSLMPGMAVSMYFLLRYYDMSLNVMRLSIAIALTILATCQLLKNKRSSFILLVILASMFHRTALIYLIAIFIWNFKVKISKKILLLLCGSVSILLVIFDFLIKVIVKFFPIYSYYLNSVYYDGNIRLATIFNIVTFTFLTLLSYMIFKRNKSEINRSAQFKEVENFCLTTIVLGILISIVSIKFNLFDRVADYFLIYILIYLPNQITKIKNTYLSILITYSLCISLILYYLIIIIYRPEWNKVYPYLFFWQ